MSGYERNFWVYENYVEKHAFIHVPWCSHCNDGKGQNKAKKDAGDNYNWKGRDSYEEAEKTLENYKNQYLTGKSEEHKKEIARDCGICKPGNRRFWYLDYKLNNTQR